MSETLPIGQQANAAANYREIEIDLIDVPAGRRALDPNWVEALGADFLARGQRTPIEVIAIDGRYRLVAGGHRIAAKRHILAQTITAVVRQPQEYASEAEIKLAEIAENFMRRELSVLDRALDVAAWREIYESAKGAVKRGGDRRSKSKVQVGHLIDAGELDEAAQRFAAGFSEAAQAALRMGHGSIIRALKIAQLDPQVRQQIALHPIADNQSELLALVGATLTQQGIIAQMIVSGQAANVATAMALIEKRPATVPSKPWEKLSDRFSRLKATEQDQFFRLHEDAVVAWMAARK